MESADVKRIFSADTLQVITDRSRRNPRVEPAIDEKSMRGLELSEKK